MIYVLFICALTSFLSVNAAQRFGPVAVKTENENRFDAKHCCFDHASACGINSSSKIDFKELLRSNDDMNNISMAPWVDIGSVISGAYGRQSVPPLEIDTVVAVITHDSTLHVASNGNNSALLIPPLGYALTSSCVSRSVGQLELTIQSFPGVSVGSILVLASAAVLERIKPLDILDRVRNIVGGDVVNKQVLSAITHALLPRGPQHNGAVVVAHMQ